MVRYTDSPEGFEARHLNGFFVDWPNPPSPETHLRLMAQSDFVVLAIDEGTDQVVGFVTALTDGVLCAYISLLEVLPEYQRRGIGEALVQRVLKMLGDLYMVDLMCDPDLEAYYAKFGMQPAFGMVIRSHPHQAGMAR